MSDRTLTLFLSNGGSLIRWQKDGILSREILLYLHFIRTGIFDRVRIFSYHGGDKSYVKRLAATDPTYHNIEIVAPAGGHESRRLGRMAWSLWGPVRHRRAIAHSAALKTNQVSGSWSALVSHWITGRPLVFRMGYLLSRRLEKNGSRFWAFVAQRIEHITCGAASRVLVTSEDTARTLSVTPSVTDKVTLAPTYVDVDLFACKTDYDFTQPVIAVGRLTPQKNLHNLILGCAAAGYRLVLVGKGPEEARLRALAAEAGALVDFVGQVSNDVLAQLLRRHTIFALPSLHEGLPKVLIEAMASGLVCIGSNIPGVTDLIEDGRTGYLIPGFRAEDIALTLRRAVKEGRADVGRAARKAIESKFSLEHYARREADIYETLQ